MLAERRSSLSPSRVSLGSRISAIGAKLGRTLSNADSHHSEEQNAARLWRTNAERSISRGREAFTSTGRGGIGNIRHASLSRDERPESGPDDFSTTRGRERIANPTQVFSTGRGGAGNLRSPSRDPSTPAEVVAVENEVIREYIATHEHAVYSSGRGGIGNIHRSRSRDATSTLDRSRSPAHIRSSSRGRVGNIHPGDANIVETIDEERRDSSTSHEDMSDSPSSLPRS